MRSWSLDIRRRIGYVEFQRSVRRREVFQGDA
jgi:hypothetical protein